jgi:FemAB-related protein (PEP-CTERM system-associated)
MKVVGCDDRHAQAWDEFVGTHERGSFYHRFAWKAINEVQLGHRAFYLAAVEAQDRVHGVFPIVQVKSRLFGNIACSLPFVNYGGVCAASPDAERLLLEEGERLCDELGVDYLEIRSRQPLASALPASQHKVSMTVALDPDPDVPWNAFKTNHRRDIRRAYKHGLSARFGTSDLLESFYAVLSESWRNLGTPLYDRRYFRAIVDAFPESTRICVVYSGAEPAAAAFCGIHGDTMEGMWLGTRAQYRPLMVGYVLYWELIKDSCERGLRQFHLGRSTADSGGEAFKKKWNASAMPLYWHYVLRGRNDLPQLNVDNPRYKLAMSTWRRLPVGVTRLVGPMIARNIP